jgi:hypothetical protein
MLSRAQVRQIKHDFVHSGISGPSLSKQHGVCERRIRQLVAKTARVSDPGQAPEECRLGIYRGYRETIEPILRANGVTWALFMGTSRSKKIGAVRWQAWSELRSKGKRLLHIAEFCGRHHTSIMHGIQRYREGHVPYDGCFKGAAE